LLIPNIFCFYLKKKTVTSTTTLPTPQADGSGLSQTAINFSIGDRGCLPLMASTARTQTQQLQLLLGPGSAATQTISSLTTDYSAYITLLCSTSGTCCNTDLCNGNGAIKSFRINRNLANILMMTIMIGHF
jgi:hypothetical protein